MSFSQQISRNLSTTRCLLLRRLTKRSNPGLDNQIAAIEDAVEIIQSDPEGFGDLESDLMNAHKTHKEYVLERQRQNDRIKHHMIRRKYFQKYPLPNFLTYAEKEQIKFLHSSDKDEWTIEKLSESFPANTEVISKVLKSNWSPMSSKKIYAHDANVFRNWERFKNGEYVANISIELREHLQKFTNRGTNDLNTIQDPTKAFVKKIWRRPKCSEFSSILTLSHNDDKTKLMSPLSYEEAKFRGKIEKSIAYNEDNDSYVSGKIQNRQPIILEELKHKSFLQHTSNCSVAHSYGSLDQQVAIDLRTSSKTGVIQDKFATVTCDYTDKFTSNEIVISEGERRRFGISSTKDRIHIPRKLWRKGATYRASDCYYDDDGEFLYRVPGMTNP